MTYCHFGYRNRAEKIHLKKNFYQLISKILIEKCIGILIAYSPQFGYPLLLVGMITR